MLSITSDFTQALQKDPDAFCVSIDPGLRGGCVLFVPSLRKLRFFELPTKLGPQGKQVLDLLLLRKQIEDFVEELEKPVAFLTLEKPFKRPQESVLTFGVSMGMIGQLLALFELAFFDAFCFGVTPKEWTAFFDGHFLPSAPNTSTKDKKKRARAEALIEAFSFSPKDFFSARGRLKDGVVDAVAILLWTLLKGKKDRFWML